MVFPFVSGEGIHQKPAFRVLAHVLNYLDQDTCTKLHEKVTEVKHMLAGFIKTLKK